MKLTKILLCLAPLALAGFARADEASSNVIELPAVVVQATRVADPIATMKATLQSRVQVAAPGRLTVKLALFSQLVSDDKTAAAESARATFSFKPARRERSVL